MPFSYRYNFLKLKWVLQKEILVLKQKSLEATFFDTKCIFRNIKWEIFVDSMTYFAESKFYILLYFSAYIDSREYIW